ncbi:chromodomain Y-like protein isoform X1 [Hydractinia symbiolongicarpus]|uniref:chromodomain Y-like protein isoform X1 n=1 Tax=Hydractinia symbiolongicarpus TaxID=13093 RepID=UPI00254E07E0|nr:chromodomain Y-like protein isoform X1 [Hydractinia symbiolongicarpus]XP_057291003.1 chromodomain Y-like protein isoform X1 [Hydractinia symbiolongicarpus]
MQVNEKIFEVEQIVCRREHRGKEEYLVYWKGFDLSSATWEPVENLLSCTDLIEQFQRTSNPIPGANPYKVLHTEKTKTVHLKMLLSRGTKNRHKRTKSMADLSDYEESNNIFNKVEVTNHSLPNGFHKKKLSESEKLLRDTLLHESKTMAPEKTSLSKINGILNCYDPIKLNGVVSSVGAKRSLNRTNRVRHSHNEELVLCAIKKNYMVITLNNTKRHNVLTIGMLDSICDCLMKAKKNSEVKAVLLTNNGDFFCSGIDYSELMNCIDDKEYRALVYELISGIRHFLGTLLTFSKPLVCAINGPVLEFGAAIVVASDLSYATSKASFDLVYNKLGLSPIGCLTHLLPQVVGNSMANSMLYIGGRYSAVSVSDRGLILDMYGVNSFQEDICKKMSQLTANSTGVLESTKKLVKHVEAPRLVEICEEELRIYQQHLCGKEARKKLKEDWTMLINLYGDL